MIDIKDIVNGDIVFKDHQATRIENLLKRLNTYPYFKNVGFDFDFWIKSNLVFSVESFQAYLSTYLRNCEVNLNSIKVSIVGKSLADIFVEINASNIVGGG